MSKVTYDDMTTIGDPLMDDNFEIIFSRLPSAAGDAATFRLFCKTGVLPGYTLDEVLQEAFGHALRFAGKKTFSGSISIEFNENSEMKIYKQLKAWGDSVKATKTQTGSFKKEYAAKAAINVFKQDGSISQTFDVLNIWPGQLPDLSFSGGAQAMTISVDFKYDIVLDSAGN